MFGIFCVLYVSEIVLGVIFDDFGGSLDDILVLRKLMQILIEKPGWNPIRQIPGNPETEGPEPLKNYQSDPPWTARPPEALHIVAEARWRILYTLQRGGI